MKFIIEGEEFFIEAYGEKVKMNLNLGKQILRAMNMPTEQANGFDILESPVILSDEKGENKRCIWANIKTTDVGQFAIINHSNA